MGLPSNGSKPWPKMQTASDSLWYTYPAFSPNGQLLAASIDDKIIFWETQDWKKLGSIPTSNPTGLTFSSDGRLLTTYTHSVPVQLWGVVEGQ
jgi:uncharacterized protein with WD repeat